MEINEVIDLYNQYIIQLRDNSANVSSLINSNNEEEAMTMISDFIEGVEWITLASVYMQKNGIDIVYDSEKVMTVLKDINLAMIQKDYLLISDIFEYEIPYLFNQVYLNS